MDSSCIFKRKYELECTYRRVGIYVQQDWGHPLETIRNILDCAGLYFQKREGRPSRVLESRDETARVILNFHPTSSSTISAHWVFRERTTLSIGTARTAQKSFLYLNQSAPTCHREAGFVGQCGQNQDFELREQWNCIFVL